MVRATPSRRVGLARAISKSGFCSRSAAFTLIRAGRVCVNGSTIRDAEKPIHLDRDQIKIDGTPLAPPAKIYLMLNKPRGVVTTASDEKNRETVYAFLDPALPWLAPVGRLDKASEGLLLLTNDSEWAARVTAPETHLDKTYHVQIGCIAAEALLSTLPRGIRSDGDLLRAKRACILRHGDRNSWLEIILDEGKNRHIRRMMEALDIEVLRLVRVGIGPLALGDLRNGESRPLAPAEKNAIDATMGKKRSRRNQGARLR